MIYPKNLEKGYKIGVTATSSGNDSEVDLIRLDSGISQLTEMGYPIIETNNVRKNYKGRSSDGKTRAKELMELFTNPEVRVIMAAGGGDYLVEMLSHIDFDLLKNHPKWLQGFSDTTGINFTITTNLDIASIYANNFSSFGMKPWHRSLHDNIRILEGNDIIQHSFDKFQDGYRSRETGYEGFYLDKDVEWKNVMPQSSKKGDELTINGRTIGGCLDVLLSLVGTRFDKTCDFVERYAQDGILWYLESYDLSSEDLTRGLWQLKEAGWFNHATGFVFGRPAMYESAYEISYEEAVLSVLGELDLPIILDADIGHKSPQVTMINGAITTITSKDGKGIITFERR